MHFLQKWRCYKLKSFHIKHQIRKKNKKYSPNSFQVNQVNALARQSGFKNVLKLKTISQTLEGHIFYY